ncbi:hypothetical protein [Nostoc sp.]
MEILTQKRTVLKNNIRNFNLYSIGFLFISLAIWFLMPIVGIFPLLVFVQLNLLKSDNLSKNIVFLNNLVLILVVLTVCIFLTSYTIYSDLVYYVQTYEQLGHLNPLDATLSYGTGTEFIPFFIAYIVYNLTNGSVYHYLFINALIINTLVVFVISKRLSSKYYPILLIVVFSTPFYYFQVPIIRHSLSNTFLMAAIAFIESSGVSFFAYLFLALFSHFSNIINIGILLFLKISKNKFKSITLNNKAKKSIQIITKFAILIIFISAVIFVCFSGGISLTIILPLINLFNLNESSSFMAENKLSNYDTYGDMVGGSLFDKIFFLFMQITIFISLIKTKDIIIFKRKDLALIIIFSIQIISYISGVISLVNWRIYYFLISMHGLFYIPIMKNIIPKNVFWNYIIVILVAGIITYNLSLFFRGLIGGWIVAPEHIFFNGRPLEMTVFDYIEFFINATPNR